MVTIYTMHPKEGKYERSEATASVPSSHQISGVIMSDFDHDGWADLLVMHQEQRSTGGTEPPTHLSLFLGDGVTLKEASSSGWRLDPAGSPVTALDYDGFMQLSLLGLLPPAKTTDKGTRKPAIWRSKATSADELSSGLKEPIELSGFKPIPSSSHPMGGFFATLADFDGDGRADLLLTFQEDEDVGLEIWSRLPSASSDSSLPFQSVLRRKLPPGTGPITVADIDGDGHLDIVFAVCTPADTCATENSLHIMYNVQRRYCSGANHRDEALARGTCRPAGEELFSNRPEEFEFQGTPGSANHLVIPLAKLFSDPVRVMFKDPLSGNPIRLSTGDYDLDSYADLALIVGSPDGALESMRAVLLRSVPCTRETCDMTQVAQDRHTLELVDKHVEALTGPRRVVNVAFADWYGMGPPGFLLNYYMDDSGKPIHMTIRNGISRDAFGLRAETLNGVCPSPCQHTNTGSTAERPLAVNFPGASYRFSFVDDAGLTQVRSGTQLACLLPGSLQSPTMLFGLGRTSNFVQTIEVGLPLAAGPSLYTKTNIFPNSEVIFWPPHADSASSWRAELQIHPSEYIWYVVGSISVALLVLALITGLFKWQEKREDDIERKKATHLINFDAL